MGQVISSTPSTIQIAVAVLGSLISLGLYKILAYVFRRTELKNLPGPERGHILFGNMKAVIKAEPSEKHALWEEEYGHVYVYHGLGNRLRLFTSDVRAIAHILQRTDIYHKPASTQQILGQLLGWGVLVAEGEQHRIQRKALNPAFGPGQLRDLTGIFLNKANELRNVWSSLLSSVPDSKDRSIRIDALTYLNRTTLDIIGLAGFGYSFDTLSSGTGEEATNEMDLAFRRLFSAAQSQTITNILSILFPFLRHIPTPTNLQIKTSMNVMRRVGNQLLEERKAAALAEAAQGEKISTSRARDLLSLLVRANTAADPRDRLSDEDVLAQIPTFLVAGHETTSSLLSWILFRLSLNPDVEKSLRQECRANPLPSTAAHGNEPLTADELSSLDHLPILDAVVRETLRLHAPVVNTMRGAVKDDVIPLSRPFTDKNGRVQDSIRVAKGDDMYIPIMLVNRLPELWGPDAKQWNPSRWTDGRVTESVKSIPGVWGNILSFLGGSHACIGYRFSLYETKIILHALISVFSLELAVPQAEISARSKVVTRPIVKSEAGRGPQMPLFIRRVDDDI